MNNNTDQSNKCHICNLSKESNLIEIEYESIKDRITENISDNENFKWLICENNNCEFWTREPKR